MSEPRPAGFWIRAVAALVDFAVFALVHLSFRWIAARAWGGDLDEVASFRPLASMFTLVFAGAYTTGLHALGGQTIGKMLVGARVVVSDGGPPTLGAALLRFFAYFASAAPFAAGFLMAALRHDKRALHDLIAGTRVERVARVVEPEAAAPPPAEASVGTAASGAA
jgi:uncharacterized RDD family membrane protein YckC